jgi:ribosomal-protein-serine acetyltransferase
MLRRRHPDDSIVVHRLVVDALPHLRPWMPWAGNGYDLAAARANATESDREWAEGTGYTYVILLGADIVGACEMRRTAGGAAMELGYWLHPAHTGRGLVTEAAGLLVAEAFALPGIEAVEIWHDAANSASGGVPRRLGFTEVARRTPPREPLTPGEVGIDVVWRITRPVSSGTAPNRRRA